MSCELPIPHPPCPDCRPGSLEKGIAILSSLGAGAHPLSLAQLCRRTQLPKSTTHRLLSLLTQLGLTRRIGNEYVIGDRVGALLYTHLHRIPGTRRLVLPHLLRLYEQTRHTVNLSVSHGLEVRHVERVYGGERVRSPSDGVDRAPLHCTASGKVMLAYDIGLRHRFRKHGSMQGITRRTTTRPGVLMQELASISAHGMAYTRGEFAGGVACAAAPVFGPEGKLCMVLSVAAPATTSFEGEIAAAVNSSARTLSETLRRAVQRDDPSPSQSL